ncbi:MAG: sigma-54 dependent transcriptional regulator [Desulfosarcinaceae bacterium]|jgi:DNA-binding NtrC family response regulator
MTSSTKPQILVVEDEKITRRNLTHILEKEGYAVIPAASGVEALELLKTHDFDLVITDLKMNQVDGMAVLVQSRERSPLTEVIMITGYATVDSAVRAMRAGAYHYIAKPFKIEAVRKIVTEALLKRRLQLENMQLKETLAGVGQAPLVIGESKAMQDAMRTVHQIAPANTNVLLLGESGTGKELAARSIHQLSPRARKPFVAFNCGSFTEELMANELFGHEKDAFTGASREKTGLLETADGGTVFLDEIGDMPQTMQIKLLRVIQEHEVLRVGGVRPHPVDIRFIAATHRDLNDDIEQGLFRQDLYYRLNVITIELPPLSAREGDIPLLANYFLALKRRAMHKEVGRIHPDAMDLLSRHSWPGNVRELENVIERGVALAVGDAVLPENLPDYLSNLAIETYRQPSGSIPTLVEQERNYIRWVLAKFDGNKTQAAAAMGIDRVSLWRKMKRYGMEG